VLYYDELNDAGCFVSFLTSFLDLK